jgi:hypothetical protein
MHRIFSIFVSLSIAAGILFAKEQEYHPHPQKNFLRLNTEHLHFIGSKKKRCGNRFGIEADMHNVYGHMQLYAERTLTETTPKVPSDLYVTKLFGLYEYTYDGVGYRVGFAHIHDNLAKETDGGKIYSIGFTYNAWKGRVYFSDYEHFDVWQSDIHYTYKGEGWQLIGIGKWIHLIDEKSNAFSRNADSDYVTVGMKLHVHRGRWHYGAAFFGGERIFAVMQDGLQVQHHAMAFKYSAMAGVGYTLSKGTVVHLRYGYHRADEIAIHNDNVKIHHVTLALQLPF